MTSRITLVAFVAGLTVTQMIGWGTTFYMPAVLVAPLVQDLGVSREAVFAGVTLMVGVSAFVSPSAGRIMDRYGASQFIMLGSAIVAAGLVLMAAHPGIITFAVAWLLFGVASPFTMSIGTLTLVAQAVGPHTKRVIGIMMLFTGLTASIFWPITSALADAFGWRATLLAFAALNLLVTVPVQLLLRRPAALLRQQSLGAAPATSSDMHGLVRDDRRRRHVAWAMMIAFSCQGFVSWGLPLHLISTFEHMGVSTAMAVTVAALTGPATIAARVVEVAVGNRASPLTTALCATALLPLSFSTLFLIRDPVIAAAAFTVLWSGGNGVMAIVRAVLPLSLFGRQGYGATMGRLALPQNLAFGAAPLVFALVLERLGVPATLWTAVTVSVAALAAMMVLARLVREGGARSDTAAKTG
jgi:predicted MFS family arabinose efflux permease